jgi:S1-C subfamily serine protease
MVKNIFKIVAFFIIGMVGGIFADQIFWPYFVERPLFYQYRLEKNPVYVTEKKEVTIQENVALQNAVEKVEKVVIGVRTQTKTKEILEGSGLIVTSDGLMVTLAELVPQGSDFSFFVDGKKVSYQILKRDLKENLALVKIGESNLPTVSFANLEKMKLGERIFLIGVVFKKGPKLVEVEPRQMVNEGIVKRFDEDFITTNISERTTLAGSPLFNIKGEVLGINTIDLEGKVITIPISKIKTFIGM